MKVTTTITIEIKDAKHELTQAEAKSLLAALKAALEPPPPYAPAGGLAQVFGHINGQNFCQDPR